MSVAGSLLLRRLVRRSSDSRLRRCDRFGGELAVLTNRISEHSFASAPTSSFLPSGFAVCPVSQPASSPLALQLLAQQQAYEQAILAAREEALRIVLSRLQTSLN